MGLSIFVGGFNVFRISYMVGSKRGSVSCLMVLCDMGGGREFGGVGVFGIGTCA